MLATRSELPKQRPSGVVTACRDSTNDDRSLRLVPAGLVRASKVFVPGSNHQFVASTLTQRETERFGQGSTVGPLRDNRVHAIAPAGTRDAVRRWTVAGFTAGVEDMSFRKGTRKGVVAAITGVLGQLSGAVPPDVLGPQFPVLGQYMGLVVGTFVGLVVGDFLMEDLTADRPIRATLKGVTAALGAVVPVVLIHVRELEQFCGSSAGAIVEFVVGPGRCYPYVEMVLAAFFGVLLSDLLVR
jgi:hypothetical protein